LRKTASSNGFVCVHKVDINQLKRLLITFIDNSVDEIGKME